MTTDTIQTCPICKLEAAYVFTSYHNRRIFQCNWRECGHFFTPVLTENQGVCVRDDDIEKESDESLRLFDERNIRLLSLFTSLLNGRSKPIVFLDFGAGNAHISRTFKRLLSDDCIMYCLESNPLCEGFYPKHKLIQVKTIDELPEKIDFIYMVEVIEHLDDPISTLKELRTCLKSNGVLFLSTPAGKRKETRTSAYDMPSHVHFFSPKSLNLTLKASGYKEIHFNYYPEMYPLEINQKITRRVWKSVKSRSIRFLYNHLRTTIGLTHLVGPTEPAK
jgi:SAM-dependent methyltransferase